MSDSSMVVQRHAALMEFSEDQRRMIRDTYANGATDAEFAVLMEIAQSLRLSPLKRQIHFIPRWDSEKGRQVWSAQASIDGLRAVAERSGLYAGQDRPVWIERDGKLVSCEVAVYRKDWPRPAVGVAFFDEYVQTRFDRQTNRRVTAGLWGKMPHLLLAKCAEALALRKAFPEQLDGVYTDDEMLHADAGGAGPVVDVERVYDIHADVKGLSADTQEPRELDTGSMSTEATPTTEAKAESSPVEATPALSTATHDSGDAQPTNPTTQDTETTTALATFATELAKVKLPGDGTALWMRHRHAIGQLSDTERQRLWQDLVETVERVGKMKNAKAWLKKAVQEALHAVEQASSNDPRDPEPDPEPAPVGGAPGSSNTEATPRARAAFRGRSASNGARARYTEEDTYRDVEALASYLRTITTPGRVAGSYWKRRADLREHGVDAEALEVVCKALSERGIREPSTFLDAVGVRNGYVAPAVVREDQAA